MSQVNVRRLEIAWASIARANGAPHISANPQSGDLNAVKKRRCQCLSLALSPSLSRLSRARAHSLYTYQHIYTSTHVSIRNTLAVKKRRANAPAKKRGYFLWNLVSLVSPKSCLLVNADSWRCCLLLKIRAPCCELFRRDAGVSFVACF